jgi:hypothetical protein
MDAPRRETRDGNCGAPMLNQEEVLLAFALLQAEIVVDDTTIRTSVTGTTTSGSLHQR